MRLDARRPVSTLTARLSVRYDYEIQLLDGASAVGTVTSPRLTWRPAPDAVRRISFGRPRAATAVWFRCGRGTGACTLAQVDVGH